MMNAANDASENWEALLRQIYRDDKYKHTVIFDDSHADEYDFSNEILMREMCRRLVEALRTSWTQPQYVNYELRFGNMFFATMSEEQQQGFFHAICALGLDTLRIEGSYDISATNIHTSALLDALPALDGWWFRRLHLRHIDLSKEPDIEALSNNFLATHQRIDCLELDHVEFPMNSNKQDEDGAVGCLDPLFYAASDLKGLDVFCLSPRTPPSNSILVSHDALYALASQMTPKTMYKLCLNNLGLNDSHCLVIEDAWNSVPCGNWEKLDLDGNDDISWEALISLIKGVNT